MAEVRVTQDSETRKLIAPAKTYGASDVPDRPKDGVKLKREVGLFGGISMVVGIIVGSGIFISPKGVLELSGSVGASLIVWVAGGLFALIGALCYAELGTIIKKSGGEYSYVFDSLGPIPAFFLSWTNVMVLKPATIAIVCLTFAEYFVELLPVCGRSDVMIKLVSAVVILTLMISNSFSVKLSNRIQILTTIAKLVAIAVIIIGGCIQLAKGNVGELHDSFKGSEIQASGIARAFYQALWAYDGWNYINYITEEVQNPEKNVPRSATFGVLLVTVIYVLTNISYLTAMTSKELLSTPAVALLWGDRILKGASIILPLAVLFSTYGSANGTMFTAGRMVYAAGRNGHMPELLSFVQIKRFTPVPSIMFMGSMALVFISMGNIGSLLDFFSFAAWIFYGLAVSSLFVLRWKKPHIKRVIKVPLLLPTIFVIFSIYLVLAPIVENPKIEFLYAASFMFGGLLLYIPLVHFKCISTDKTTTFLQQLLQVAPSPYMPEKENDDKSNK